MKNLSIDIETYSNTPLKTAGVYRYAEDESFEILLFGYSVDHGPVRVVDLASGESIPTEILQALEDDTIIKWAFNATFERICLSRFLGYPTGKYLNPEGWRCSMIASAILGLPLSLEMVGSILQLDKQKLTAGKSLIQYFCQPCTPTNKNGNRTRNLPHHDPAKWAEFKSYNLRDVEVELSIQDRLKIFPVQQAIWDEYHLSERINDNGVRLDRGFVEKAIEIDLQSKKLLSDSIKKLTGVDNPNSRNQMKEWLAGKGITTDSLDKGTVEILLKQVTPEIAEVLTLYQQLSKSSVSKYQAMQKAVCADGRARGMFQFYGSHTGRFSGRLIQLQNLPQNHLDNLSEARDLVLNDTYSEVERIYKNVPSTLSQLIRTAFIPTDNMQFLVADFSAIEARIVAWYAGETWRQEVFAQGKDIYCASASQMFNVPVEKNGINGHLRQKGKIAELALGYGGSVGALESMGAVKMGIPKNELPDLVNAWRKANPRIVDFWRKVDQAATYAIEYKDTAKTHGLTFTYKSGLLFILLPSGRYLAYVKPRVEFNDYGYKTITYEGTDSESHKWERLKTYGAKLVENIVQATARDILCFALNNLRSYSIVMHIHDEVVIEANPHISLETVCEQMNVTPEWAKGLLLRADGYTTPFYRKD